MPLAGDGDGRSMVAVGTLEYRCGGGGEARIAAFLPRGQSKKNDFWETSVRFLPEWQHTGESQAKVGM